MRRSRSSAVARYRDAAGDEHTVIVRSIDDGWEVVDENGNGGKVVEQLTDPADNRACAEALARDYARWAKLPTWARQ